MDGRMHGDILHYTSPRHTSPHTQPYASLHFTPLHFTPDTPQRRLLCTYPLLSASPLPGSAPVHEAALVGRVHGLCGALMIPPDWFHRSCRIIQLPTSTSPAVLCLTPPCVPYCNRYPRHVVVWSAGCATVRRMTAMLVAVVLRLIAKHGHVRERRGEGTRIDGARVMLISIHVPSS
jgi:hypothetical protein